MMNGLNYRHPVDQCACFTGHRFISSGNYPVIARKLYSILEECYHDGYRFFYCGGALGFDTIASLMVIELRKNWPDMKLCLVLPCKDQDSRWSPDAKRKYLEIIGKADEVTVLADHYFHGCMHIRNQYMVTRSSLCISYLLPSVVGGGTWSTCIMAKNRGIPVINITSDEPPARMKEEKCCYTSTSPSAKGNVPTADLYLMSTGTMKPKHISRPY